MGEDRLHAFRDFEMKVRDEQVERPWASGAAPE